jgi:hypothetical protein
LNGETIRKSIIKKRRSRSTWVYLLTRQPWAQDWDNTIEMKVKKKYKDLFQKNKMLKDEIEKKIYLKKD